MTLEERPVNWPVSRENFFEDIFGSDARKELGFVDVASRRDEVDTILESLYPVWIRLELEDRRLTSEDSILCYSYFFLHYWRQQQKECHLYLARNQGRVEDWIVTKNNRY